MSEVTHTESSTGFRRHDPKKSGRIRGHGETISKLVADKGGGGGGSTTRKAFDDRYRGFVPGS